MINKTQAEQKKYRYKRQTDFIRTRDEAMKKYLQSDKATFREKIIFGTQLKFREGLTNAKKAHAEMQKKLKEDPLFGGKKPEMTQQEKERAAKKERLRIRDIMNAAAIAEAREHGQPGFMPAEPIKTMPKEEKKKKKSKWSSWNWKTGLN